MKTAKDSTRPKGNYDWAYSWTVILFWKEKNWEMGIFSIESVIKNTKGQLQVIEYGALSAKLQCIPSSAIGCSVKHVVPLQFTCVQRTLQTCIQEQDHTRHTAQSI